MGITNLETAHFAGSHLFRICVAASLGQTVLSVVDVVHDEFIGSGLSLRLDSPSKSGPASLRLCLALVLLQIARATSMLVSALQSLWLGSATLLVFVLGSGHG